MVTVRHAVGAAGAALMGVGAWLVAGLRDPLDVLVWLAGAVVLHDGLLAPLVLGAGVLLGGLRTGRAPVRGALIVAGCLTLVALPVLLRPGTPANSSVLPLDYVRNWLLLLAATAGGTGAYLLFTRARSRRHARRLRQRQQQQQER
ncbi:hypothetical protein ACFQVC_09485 [Streptomyces monticola]|uniref:Transmembrane protein n=1 Tax=Streptomyces monticola TaxID=2666263 RepID=A0ABW2JG96_9ACTN